MTETNLDDDEARGTESFKEEIKWASADVLQQFKHVQMPLQATAAWKHSQYFLRHKDFLHLQPFLWAMAVAAAMGADEDDSTAGLNFESKALGLRSSIILIASLRIWTLSV